MLPSADSLRLTIEANAIRQLVPPEAFSAVRRQRRVKRRVLEIAVPEVMPRENALSKERYDSMPDEKAF